MSHFLGNATLGGTNMHPGQAGDDPALRRLGDISAG